VSLDTRRATRPGPARDQYQDGFTSYQKLLSKTESL